MRNNIELQSIGLDPAVTLAYTAVRAPERECPNMVTPEPATFLLVGMAMACVLVRKLVA